MFTDYFDFLVVFSSIVSIYFVNLFYNTGKQNRRPILDIYQQTPAFYYIKVVIAYLLVKTSSLFKKEENYNEIDKAQTLSYSKKPLDAVYFNGSNSHGDHFIVGLARRGLHTFDSFIYLKLADTNLGLLGNLALPFTTNRSQSSDSSSDLYYSAGITITPVEPMRHWRITYTGAMRSDVTGETVDVNVTADWRSQMAPFHFDTDGDSWEMAKAMASETWTKDYFETLKFIHQTHYEQNGDVKLTVEINGNQYKSEIQCVRDHSFGFQREWRLFHRYALHFLTTENGDRISVGVVSMPIAFSRLVIGHVYSARDNQSYPVSDCNLHLYQHGENGQPPDDYAFQFKAGKRMYIIQVKVTDSQLFYISKTNECKIFEQPATFSVNGLKGWGATEWQYRNINKQQLTV